MKTKYFITIALKVTLFFKNNELNLGFNSNRLNQII